MLSEEHSISFLRVNASNKLDHLSYEMRRVSLTLRITANANGHSTPQHDTQSSLLIG